MFGFVSVCVCLSNLLPGGREINRGTNLQMTDLESLRGNPLEP